MELLHTTTDGVTWSPVAAPPTGPVAQDSAGTKVRFADSEDGWVFSTLPGEGKDVSWATHDGGKHWSAITFPVKSPNSIGVEDIEAAGGSVHAAVQVGDTVVIFSAPVGANTWRKTGGPYSLGAGPVPSGELVLQGGTGWFVQNDRVAISGARYGPPNNRGAAGKWDAWQPPCTKAGGPVVLAAPTTSQVDAVCTEGVWTGPKITVDLLTSTNGGASFGMSRPVPVGSAGIAAAADTSTVAVGASAQGGNSVAAVIEMTFNAGVSWQQVYRGPGSGWLELGFTTPSQGVGIVDGAGGTNTMLSTADGGRHWAPVNFR
jgi:hypothetical protein